MIYVNCSFGYYSTMKATTPSKFITWNDLAELVRNPSQLDKSTAPLLIPHNGQGKTKEYANSALYCAIIIDFDDVSYTVQEGTEKVKELYQGTFLYFTTASHLQEGKGNRFKVVIPLNRRLDSNEHFILSNGISLLFGADIAQARNTQGFYAPNTLNMENYQGDLIKGNASALDEDSELYTQATAKYNQLIESQKQIAIHAKPKPRENNTNTSSIIELINQAYDIESLLAANGYIKRGKCWLAPNSTSGMAGVHVLDGKRIYSHHSNDPLSAANHGNHSLDVADVLCALAYNGDFTTMIKEEANNLDPEGQKERRVQYMQSIQTNLPNTASNDPTIKDYFANTKPNDLFDEFPLPEIDMALFPTQITDYVIDQSKLMGADPAAMAIFCLGTLSGSITDEIRIQPKKHDNSWTECSRIWCAVIGDPSTKKSPLLNKALSPLKDINTKWIKESNAAIKKWEEACKIAKKEDTQTPEKPLKKRLIIEDTTTEKLGVTLSECEPRGLLSVRDELSGWLGGMDAYKNGTGNKDKPLWLEAYNGGQKMFERVSRGDTFVDNWSVSIVGGIQPSVIQAYAKTTEHDGLLQRFILLYAKQSHSIGEDRAINMAAKNKYDALIIHLANLGGSNNAVLLSDDAHTSRSAFERQIHKIMKYHPNPHIKAALGKWSGLYARLLLIWHCCDAHEQSIYPTNIQVSKNTADKVIKFMLTVLLPHMVKFYSALDPLEDITRELAKLILAKEWQRFTPKRDFNNYWKKSRTLKPWEIKTALERLEAFSWITPEYNATIDKDGIAKAYIVNKEIHTLFTEQKAKEIERRKDVTETMQELKQLCS